MSSVVQYDIIKKINAGSKAEIFLGVLYSDKGFQRLCAIKKLLPQFANDQEAILGLKREADVCLRLQHTNVVSMIDFDRVDGTHALIMEYVNGSNGLKIFEVCNKLRMQISVAMAAHMGAEVARALYYIHTQIDPSSGKPLGIIHGDLSPDNILVSYAGEVKLADFGSATRVNEVSPTHNVTRDKYRYMSPEYFHTGKADQRQDIYSLGVILWEFLAGAELFKGDSIEEISRLKLEGINNLKLSEFNELVDEELEEIIRQCLYYDPVKRYASARDLEAALSSYFHKRDPDFTPLKLGAFLQSLFQKDYEATLLIMKEALGRKRNMPIRESDAQTPKSFVAYFSEQPVGEQIKREVQKELVVNQQRGQSRGRRDAADDDPLDFSHFAPMKKPNYGIIFFAIVTLLATLFLTVALVKNKKSKTGRQKPVPTKTKRR